ncbi:amidophosphoribosyltransferase [Prosthecochloris sp. N3]|uniref:Amidophosphoribosyltransferase n=1 Tax=Prosthecochloris ethylica TaxID=2743976 RepID=A0ABR9XVK2_9CHLB|nr:amidophosphoribosyltransferase [Prosthecochloris ethylica]MBF0587382.1 amidophosphoribosyltransferase [Prosthecochloris ethylica]MBF0637661.1 amidophosphoribosyltransferase [Prosthecochloris ethylica]NUK48275.1 amidophosphoribosyltransferase [Prosthecochloris ethylica]
MCGVFGVYNSKTPAEDTFYGLYSLQHRGQEAAGIVVAGYDEDKKKTVYRQHKGMGLVAEVFKDEELFDKLHGYAAIGHNRYSTTGASKSASNIQPFSLIYRSGNLAIAHNGNLTNSQVLRKELTEKGVIFHASSDTEVIPHLAALSREKEPVHQIYHALRQVEGAFSLVMMANDQLIAARDPYGVRPLALGMKIDPDTNEASYYIASETCAFDILSVDYVRDIEPGEILLIDKISTRTHKPKSLFLPPSKRKARCIFEYVYFARPDSTIFQHSVDKIRRNLGKNLARESTVQQNNGDKHLIVASVPDSSNTAALGFVRESNKINRPARFEHGLIRNHYVGRTFIQPGKASREIKVRSKYNIIRGVLQNRQIILIDDSIVRGTTARMLIKLIREADPKEIHLHISSPPITNPCFYGMDFPTKGQLLTNMFDGAENEQEEIESIRKYIGVESLKYLSLQGLLNSVPKFENETCSYCTACFTGDYPITVADNKGEKEECEC